MAIGDLEWVGRAWPAATITGKMKTAYKDVRSGVRGPSVMACEAATTGAGREYTLQGPWAFWRNFAAARPDDESFVGDFLRRRGDPFGELGPDTPIDTGDWPSISSWLEPLAAFWGEAGADKVSRIVRSDEDLDKAVTSIKAAPLFQSGIDWDIAVVDGSLRTRIKARSLASFMLTSALLNLEARTKMGICEECKDWFGIQREGARFCSPSCRALHSTKNKGKANG